MSNDLTPLEQAQSAYRDLRENLDLAKRHGIELDTRFLEAPREEDTKQELLKKFAHVCEVCRTSVLMQVVSPQLQENKAGKAAKKAEMELKKEADKRQAEIDEVAKEAQEILNRTKELHNEHESLCRHCAEKNPADAVYCRRCGKKIERTEEEEEDEEDEEDEGTKENKGSSSGCCLSLLWLVALIIGGGFAIHATAKML